MTMAKDTVQGVSPDIAATPGVAARRAARADALGWVALVALLALYAVVALTHLAGVRWDFDEGIAASQARLMADGYSLYDPVWTDHTPGQPVLIALAFGLLGPTVAAARAVTVLHALVGLFAVAWAARVLGRRVGLSAGFAWLAGLTALTLLAVAPNFWWASRAAMKGVMTFGLAALAMALALSYSETGRTRWLVAASLALGLSLWVKLQMAYLVPLLLVLVVAVRLRRPWRASLPAVARDVVVTLAGASLFLAASLLVYPPTAFVAQVWGTYQSTREAYDLSVAANLGILSEWLLADNAGLLALTLAGGLVVLVRRTREGLVILAWLALTIATPLQHSAVSTKIHFLPALYPMAVLSGVAVAVGIVVLAASLRQSPAGWRPPTWLLLPIGLGSLLYLGSLPHVMAINQTLLIARPYENDGHVPALDEEDVRNLLTGSRRTRRAIAFMQAHSRPTDFIVTDEQLYAFMAGRRVPPELAAMSSRRIQIGDLTGDDIVETFTLYEPPIVIMWGDKLMKPGVGEYMGTHYYFATDLGDSKLRAYLRNDIPLAEGTP